MHLDNSAFAMGEGVAHLRLSENVHLDGSVAYCERTGVNELRALADLAIVNDENDGFRIGFVYVNYDGLASYFGVSLSRALATVRSPDAVGDDGDDGKRPTRARLAPIPPCPKCFQAEPAPQVAPTHDQPSHPAQPVPDPKKVEEALRAAVQGASSTYPHAVELVCGDVDKFHSVSTEMNLRRGFDYAYFAVANTDIVNVSVVVSGGDSDGAGFVVPRAEPPGLKDSGIYAYGAKGQWKFQDTHAELVATSGGDYAHRACVIVLAR